MRAGNFSVLVPQGAEKSNGQIVLENGQQYTLQVGNHSKCRCDAIVSIDGSHLADFRLEPYQNLHIEGPPQGDKGKFTFISSHSEDAFAAGIEGIVIQNRGLITVRFKPEYKPHPRPGFLTRAPQPGTVQASCNDRGFSPTPKATCSVAGFSEEKTSSGITGLTGRHDQQWATAAPISYDPAGEVLINVRLVASDPTAYCGVRPLQRMEASVPPMATN